MIHIKKCNCNGGLLFPVCIDPLPADPADTIRVMDWRCHVCGHFERDDQAYSILDIVALQSSLLFVVAGNSVRGPIA